ncbi:4293_t:CDS:2, partial [Scutellospora calospora]
MSVVTDSLSGPKDSKLEARQFRFKKFPSSITISIEGVESSSFGVLLASELYVTSGGLDF